VDLFLKKKALVLLSGGLDSTLAAKLVIDQGLDVEAVHFSTPFCNCDKCAVDKVGEDFDLKVHHAFLGQDFLDLLVDPPHGYGSNMNICIDCRILMFKKAKELAGTIGAEYFVTGEVLGQRPFSQRKSAMKLIERETGLERKILRPLSAKLFEETEVEHEGLVDREKLGKITGRRRIAQMELAKEIGVYDYPCPSGGCLLTDPQFSKRLQDYLSHEGRPRVLDMFFLRIGRHFRINGIRVIVGRNEQENNALNSLSEKYGWDTLVVSDYMGPTTVILESDEDVLSKAAAITVRYSDAPKETLVKLIHKQNETKTLVSESMHVEEIEAFRI
jgi:tRNA U34 2-thiouridine synthase MnmA/TrmU